MNSFWSDESGRREFFKSCARVAALAGLGAASALAMRGETDADCRAGTFCRECRALRRCDKPQARSALRGMED